MPYVSLLGGPNLIASQMLLRLFSNASPIGIPRLYPRLYSHHTIPRVKCSDERAIGASISSESGRIGEGGKWTCHSEELRACPYPKLHHTLLLDCTAHTLPCCTPTSRLASGLSCLSYNYCHFGTLTMATGLPDCLLPHLPSYIGRPVITPT